MKCDRCGTELKEGNVYCENCGRAIQIVPDYNVLEDDVLPAMIADERKMNTAAGEPDPDETAKKKRNPAAYVIVSIILIAVIGVVGYFNSTPYKANRLREEGKNFYRMGDDTNAEKRFLEAKELEPNKPETYRLLLMLYQKNENFDAIDELYEHANRKEIRALFTDYRILPPAFSELSGSYEENLEVSLSSLDGYDIYFTTDGSTPAKEADGTKRYVRPIELTDGETTIKACCVNENGVWGRIAEETYDISYAKPNMPEASPSHGTFHSPRRVTLIPEHEDDEIYYTWRKTEPTEKSTHYTGPISIPAGNNVLSVIAVSKYGEKSDVLKCNYVYQP